MSDDFYEGIRVEYEYVRPLKWWQRLLGRLGLWKRPKPARQTRTITSYVGQTRIATVDRPFSPTPKAGDWLVLPDTRTDD